MSAVSQVPVPVRLRTLDDRSSEEVPDEVIESARLIKLFEVHENRNAWWSTPITYIGVFRQTFAEAQAAAERRRKQGSHFYISEVFGTVFVGQTASVVVPRWPSPRKNFKPRLPATLHSLAAAEGRASGLRLYLAKKLQFANPDGAWRRYEASPYGTFGRLSWDPMPPSDAVARDYNSARLIFAKYLILGIFADQE